MKSPLEIRNLAYERLDDASILFRKNKIDAAFYLAGYSVELMLKAKICENWGISNLFDLEDTKVKKEITTLRNVVKTHDLKILLILSNLISKLEIELANNKTFFKTNSLLEKWKESIRYDPVGSFNKKDVKEFLEGLKRKNGLLKWIEKN